MSLASISMPTSATPATTRNATSAPSVKASNPNGASSAATEFRNFLDLSPVERMRASLLSGMGLKEADLANLSQTERQRVEDQIKAGIKEAFGGKTGRIADIRA